jgi:hypothetical protein
LGEEEYICIMSGIGREGVQGLGELCAGSKLGKRGRQTNERMIEIITKMQRGEKRWKMR